MQIATHLGSQFLYKIQWERRTFSQKCPMFQIGFREHRYMEVVVVKELMYFLKTQIKWYVYYEDMYQYMISSVIYDHQNFNYSHSRYSVSRFYSKFFRYICNYSME